MMIHFTTVQGSLNYLLWGNQSIPFCGSFEGLPPKKQCIVWVGNIMTPVLYVTTVDVFMYYFLATNKVDPEERRKQLIAEATETDGATDQPVIKGTMRRTDILWLHGLQ